MDVGKSSSWPPGPTVCRCCLAEGCYKDISTEYFWMGKREVYAEMLTETFDLAISYAQSAGTNSNSRLICEPCISRLRDASEFKRQVSECERMFTTLLEPGSSGQSGMAQVTLSRLGKDVKVERVKVKKEDSEDDDDDDMFAEPFGDDDDDDDADDEPLTNLATKIPKKEAEDDIFGSEDKPKPAEKRKATVKAKAVPAKKAKATVTKAKGPAAKVAKPQEKKKRGDHPDLSRQDGNTKAEDAFHEAYTEDNRLDDRTIYESEPSITERNQNFDLNMYVEKENTTDYNMELENSCNKTGENYLLDSEDTFLQMMNLNKDDDNVSIQANKEDVNKDLIKNLSNKLDSTQSKVMRLNAIILLEFTSICPFRWKMNKYVCFYCGEEFSKPDILEQHKISQHATLSNNEIKRAVGSIKKYELIKADITNIVCNICDDRFKDLADVKFHLVASHSQNLNLEIPDGILPFKLFSGDFKCALCDSDFTDYKTLNQHMNTHFQNYICELCGAGFVSPSRLRSHYFSHGTEKVPCEVCKKYFKSENARKEHHANVHMKVKRHRCPHCPEAFRNYFQRNKHITSVHNLKVKEYKCKYCDKVFKNSGKLPTHINTVHLKLKRHSCEFCEWKFYSKSELKDHMVRHGGDRKYKCDVCKKSYARKYTLQEHLRIHENDRRFVCNVCGKSFIQNCSLKHHAKVHMPYVTGP
ncbi:zinc finger protein 613 isoform X2 [Plutella xylostella]|nr:zinc finger protein 613 isoform X2 [Plutella xylostella]